MQNDSPEGYLRSKGLTKLSRENIDSFAYNIASAYVDYSVFKWTFDTKNTTEDMKKFFKITFRTMLDNSVTFSTGEKAESVISLLSPNVKATTTWDYIKAGGIMLYVLFGFNRIDRITKYEDFTSALRAKYCTGNTWYLYDFTTCPEYQHQGYGKQVFLPVLEWMDENGHDLYLETAEDRNIAMYEKYGFELVESTTVPNSNGVPHYCMLRHPQTSK